MSPQSASVAILATVAPLWPGSTLFLSPGSLAGLAHGLLFSLYTCFPLFGPVYHVCFLETLFPSQTVGARCLFCVSSPTQRPAWRLGCAPRPKEVMSPLFHPNSLYPWATKNWDFCPGFLTGMEILGSLDFKRLLHTTLLTSCIPSYISPTSCSRLVCDVHFTR